MKCVIIAGGVSKRLKPLTEKIPKTLLQLDEKLILEHILDTAISVGLTDFDIITGHGHEFVAEFIERYQSERPGISIRLIFVDEYLTAGNIIALRYAADALNDDIVWINSDTIFHKLILEQLLESPHRNVMVVDDHKELGEEEMKVLINENGNIYRIHKSLNPGESHGEYVGILKFSPDIREKLLESAEALMQTDSTVYYEDAIQKMIDDFGVEVKHVSTQGRPVMEIDTHEDLAAAKELIKQMYD